MAAAALFASIFLLLCTTTLGIDIFKTMDTEQQWKDTNEAPVADAVVVQRGVVSSDWTPFSFSRNTLLVSINSVLYAFLSAPRENLFIETQPTTTFLVNTRAAYELQDVSIYGESNTEPDTSENVLRVTASYSAVPGREESHWLTVSYQCRQAGSINTVSARLRMIDFDEIERDVVFYWKKQCSEVEIKQSEKGWLTLLADLDPAKPLFDKLAGNARREPTADSSSWSLASTSIALLLCVAGAALLIVAILMDVVDSHLFVSAELDASGSESSSTDRNSTSSAILQSEEGRAKEDEEQVKTKGVEVVLPPVAVETTTTTLTAPEGL